ncbi:putative pentatricopeptide repeat-containing protein At1g12700, mitochondrial [Pistacia vera]|uniref:putative pentatricopeptide repeat-containing protein At1g12700, mitochondrial n=1 Tax=Pistacia vera TaxID=55513 RepID=UPI001263C317|nr:putative pentatricopeptide repeat-containing protein At1g12700, mitochondrial [Pistacia vera]
MESMELFKKMIVVGCRPNVITCNTLSGGLCKTRKISVAIKVHEEMAGLVENARQLFLEHMIQRGVVPDIYTYNILINGYCLNKEVNEALSLYREMISKGMLTGFFLIAKVKDAQNLVGEMQLNDAFPDSSTYNILIDGLCKNRCVLEALEMFSTLVINKFAVGIEEQNPAKVHPAAQMIYIGYDKQKVPSCNDDRGDLVDMGFQIAIEIYEAAWSKNALV